MNSETAVEWELVDYGAAVFHVASFRRPTEPAAPPVLVLSESDEGECSWRSCLAELRCWEWKKLHAA